MEKHDMHAIVCAKHYIGACVMHERVDVIHGRTCKAYHACMPGISHARGCHAYKSVNRMWESCMQEWAYYLAIHLFWANLWESRPNMAMIVTL